ncbi:MAG: HIT family protein [Nitrososphaera sp.]
MAECPFCQLVREGLPPHTLYADDTFFVILDRESLGPGHCLIVPRRHVARIYDLDNNEYSALFQLARKLAVRLQDITGSKAVGYVAFGTGLPHAHLHLVPHSDPRVLSHPNPRKLSEDELEPEARRIRPLLERT